jgi:hypothetical protein
VPVTDHKFKRFPVMLHLQTVGCGGPATDCFEWGQRIFVATDNPAFDPIPLPLSNTLTDERMVYETSIGVVCEHLTVAFAA